MPPQSTPWSELESLLHSESPQKWLNRLAIMDTNQFNQHKIALLRFATGDQLRELLRLAKDSDANPHLFTELRSTLEKFNPYTTKGIEEYKRHDNIYNDYILHYYHCIQGSSDPLPANHGPLTIIGFTGDASILMAPLACILSVLGQGKHDLILVKRLVRKPYCEEDASLLLSMEQQISRLITRQRLADGRSRQVITLGTSTGGLAALTMAHRLALPLGVGVGALLPSSLGRDRARWFAGLQESPLRKQHVTHTENHTKAGGNTARTHLRLVAGAASAGDRTNALRIRTFYERHHPHTTTVQIQLMAGCRSHGLFEELANQGRSLDTVLPELFSLNQAGYCDAACQAIPPPTATRPDPQV